MSNTITQDIGRIHLFRYGNYLEYDGKVYEPNNITVWVNSWPATWATPVSAPAGSYILTYHGADYHASPYDTNFDTSGDCLEYITFDDNGRLVWDRMRALEYGDDNSWESPAKELAQFHYHMEGDHAIIDDVYGNLEKIVIPDELEGHRVKKATLKNPLMASITKQLIVAEYMNELDVVSWKLDCLEVLDLPTELKLSAPPDGVNFTPWFRNLPSGQVNLCGYYCGTVGIKAGALKIWHNTVGVISNADCHANWTSIDFADFITYIGKNSFSFCEHLEHVNLPSYLRKIDDYAFRGCKRLRNLFIPNICEDITTSFDLCTGLQEVSMPAVCYRERGSSSPFPNCPKIICREGGQAKTILQDVKPDPVSGVTAIFYSNQPFHAAGRKFYNLDQLALTPVAEFDFLDSYRQPTRFHCYNADGFPLHKLYEYGTHNYWFLRGENGLTQIYMREGDDYIILIEGIDPNDVAEPIRTHAADYLFSVID